MTTGPTRTPSSQRRAGGTTLLVLIAGLVLTAPALADELDDIQDEKGAVEQQQRQAGQERGDLDAQIVELDDHLDETSTALVEADQQVQATTGKVDTARIALAEAEEELSGAQEEANRIEGELSVARAEEEKIETSLATNKTEQQQSRAAVGAMARESYKSGGLGSVAMTLEVLSGGADAVQDMAMARTVLRVQDQTIDRLSTQQAQEAAEGDRLAGVRQDVALLLAQAEANIVRKEDARDAAEQAKGDLDDLLTQQDADKAALEQEKATVEQQLDTAEQESDDLQTQLADLAQRQHGLEIAEATETQRVAEEEARRIAEEEARRIAEEEARRIAEEEARRSAAAQAEEQRQVEAAEEQARRQQESAQQAPSDREPSEPARAATPPPAAPAEPAPAAPAPVPAPAPAPVPAPPSGVLSPPSRAGVTSTFGYRMHPILGYSRLHAGIDYAGACGSPVYAPADGLVIGTPSTQGGGNKLLIDHGVHRGVNLVTTYSHLSGYAVTSGSVSRGQLIARVGSTGLSTGCHLHFETRENGIPVDPFSWL